MQVGAPGGPGRLRLVSRSPAAVLEWSRTDAGRKAIKYTTVSVISTVISQLTFVLVYGVWEIWGSRGSAIFANFAGAIPSYYLNRNWAWGKSGRSHVWREVAPFWALFVVGLVFSTWSADFAHSHTHGIHNHVLHTAVVTGAYLGAFGVLWIGKFLIFNRYMFIDHHHRRPADGE
jgi:putative flippase GtrA